MPWLYRNYLIYGRISINSSLGQNLWIGIQEKTNASTYLPNGKTYFSLIPNDEWLKINGLNPIEQSDYFIEKYKAEIKNHPSLWLKMYLIKLENFWLFREGIGMEYSVKIKRFIPFYQVIYISILLLTLYFVYISKRNSIVIFSIPLALSFIHALFYVETRHRVITEPILFFMAACAAFMLLEKFSNKKNAKSLS
jgi:hypothetical protein